MFEVIYNVDFPFIGLHLENQITIVDAFELGEMKASLTFEVISVKRIED